MATTFRFRAGLYNRQNHLSSLLCVVGNSIALIAFRQKEEFSSICPIISHFECLGNLLINLGEFNVSQKSVAIALQ
jgi:hypothetical protein